MSNSIGKFLVFLQLTLSVVGLSWSAVVYLKWTDWGWQKPRQDLNTLVASEFDTRVALYHRMVNHRDTHYVPVKSAQAELLQAQKSLAENTLSYDEELARIRTDPNTIEVKSFKPDEKGEPALDTPAASPGTGYRQKDVLEIVGGKFKTPAKLEVVSVNGSGGVTGVVFQELGVYSEIPANPVSVKDGTGAGATFNLASVKDGTGADAICKFDPSSSFGKPVLETPVPEIKYSLKVYEAKLTNLRKEYREKIEEFAKAEENTAAETRKINGLDKEGNVIRPSLENLLDEQFQIQRHADAEFEDLYPRFLEANKENGDFKERYQQLIKRVQLLERVKKAREK